MKVRCRQVVSKNNGMCAECLGVDAKILIIPRNMVHLERKWSVLKSENEDLMRALEEEPKQYEQSI